MVGSRYERAVRNGKPTRKHKHIAVGQWWHNPDMRGPLETEITTSMIVWQSSWVPSRSGSLETEKPTESTRKVVVD